MIEARVEVDLDAVDKATDIFRRGFSTDDLKNTQAAVKAGGQFIQSEWMKYVSGSPVTYSGGSFIIHRVSGQYQEALSNGFRYPMNGDSLVSGVEVNLDYAEKLERGFDSFDEKPGMLAKAVRFSADGKPYMNIRFEHSESGVPGAIKAEVAKKDRSLGLIRTGVGRESAPAGIRSQLSSGYTWKVGLFTGMTRGKQESTAAGELVTFRRVSLASDPKSWIHPGVTPKPVTKALKENTSAQLSDMVCLSFKDDVLRLSQMAGFP